MISRLMLSLKKVSSARESGWTSDALLRTDPRIITQIKFRDPSNGREGSGGTTSDEVELFDLSDRQVRRRSGERIL